MRTFTAATVAVALLTTASSALNLIPRDGPAAVVNLNINRKHVQNPATRDQLRMRRRQSQTVSQTLDNEVSIVQHLSKYSDSHGVGNAIFRQRHVRHPRSGVETSHRYRQQRSLD